MVDTPPDKTTVQCECGARLTVPPSAAGRKAKCPKCGNVFVIQMPEPEEGSTYSLSPEPDSFSLMDELAQAEKTAAPIDTPAAKPRSIGCPKCGENMPADARVCMACGYDKETGRTLKASVAKPKRSVVSGLVRKTGGFMLGSFLSFIGALIGAGVWFGVAVSANVEVVYIALAVGVLAGLGMWLGYRQENLRAGVVAAGMSLFGILTAKVLIFAFVINAMITGNTSNIEFQRAFLAADKAEKILDEDEIWDEEERDAKWETTYEEAERSIKNLSDKEVRRRVEVVKADLERDEAVYDEVGRKKIRLARFRADRKAEELDLAPGDNKRERYYKQAFAECRDMEEAELDDELAELDDWEKVGRWESGEYVRAHLIEQRVEKATEARRELEAEKNPDDYWEPDDRESKKFYDAAREEVLSMSAEDRLAMSKSMEAEQDRKWKVERLARHRASREADAQGLSHAHPERDSLYEEAQAHFLSLDDKAIQNEAAALDEWEAGGKWSDEDFVHDHLVYELIRRTHKEQRGDRPYEPPTEEEWSRLHAEAVEKVETIPVDERVAYAENLRAEREREAEQASEESEAAEAAEARSDLAAVFFSSMFDFLDIIFVMLAVSSAFGIATRGLGGSRLNR